MYNNIIFDFYILVMDMQTQPVAKYMLEVDLDGDGSFSHAQTDFTQDLQARSIRTSRGKNYAAQRIGRSIVGKLSAQIKDFEGEYDRSNFQSPLAGLFIPQREIRFSMEAGTFLPKTTLWQGYLDRPSRNEHTGRRDFIRIVALDILSKLRAAPSISTPLRNDIETADAIGVILDLVGIPANRRGTIAGTKTISKWWLHNNSALQSAHAVELTEGGFLRVDESGNIHMDSNVFRLFGSRRTPVAIFSDNPTDPSHIGIQRPRVYDRIQDVYNIVEPTWRNFDVTAEQDLILMDGPINIPGNGSITLTFEYPDITSPAGHIAVEAWGQPTFTANNQQNNMGTDRFGSIMLTITETARMIQLDFTNNHAEEVWLFDLIIPGQVLEQISTSSLREINQESIDKFDPRPLPNDIQFFSNDIEARAFAQQILLAQANPQQRADITFPTIDDQTLMLAAVIDTSDRVTLIRHGEARDMFVESIHHDVKHGGRHLTRLGLSPASSANIIILDDGPGLDTGVLG